MMLQYSGITVWRLILSEVVPLNYRVLVENCPTPSNITGLTIANNIFVLASHFGSVKLFKAYLEIAELPVSRSVAIRSELQCSGVSLVDCPHNGRKEVADKMMLGQIMSYWFPVCTSHIIEFMQLTCWRMLSTTQRRPPLS